MAMNKTMAIILCGALLILGSCSPSENFKSLKTAEQLMEEDPDSAWYLLGRIDKTLLKEGKEQALYHLLYAQAQYKLYMPIKSDSLLDYSETYYSRHGDDYYRANTYYYKGNVLLDQGEVMKSALYLKKAESCAQKINDELLKNKIYEALVDVNERASNIALSLKYNKEFLKSSILLNDSELICRAYDGISFDFDKMCQYDSSRFYRAKCNELLPKAKIYLHRYLANYASDLMKEKKYQQAKKLILKADSIEHRAYHFNMLSEISLYEGDTIRAAKYIEKALQNGDYATYIQAYRNKARLCFHQGRDKEAYALLLKADSLTHDYNERVRPIAIAMYQKEFDLAQADLEASRLQNRWLMALLLSVFLLSGCIIFYLLKARRLKTVVSKNIIALNEAKNEVEHLRQTDENHGKMVSQLNMKIQRLNEEMALRLGTGKEIYEKVVRREPLAGFTADDEQCLIDYYAYTYGQRFASILLPYQSPTRRLVTYLIMCDMGLSDKEIQQVLRISSSTIRSYRYRLK